MKFNARYKVLFKAPSVKEADVKKAHDFDAILDKHEKLVGSQGGSPWYKSAPTPIIGVVSLVFVSFLIYWVGFQADQYETKQTSVPSASELKLDTTKRNDQQDTQTFFTIPDTTQTSQQAKSKKSPKNLKNNTQLSSSSAVDFNTKTTNLLSDTAQKPVPPKDTTVVMNTKNMEQGSKQNPESDSIAHTELIPSIYEAAKPIDGFPKLYQYFADSVRYPEALRADQVTGTVKVKFIINLEGKPEDIKVRNSLHELLDQEAIRVVQHMPLWKPAKRNGRAIKSRLTIPITFQIQDTAGP